MRVPDYVIYALAATVIGGTLFALALAWLFRRNKRLEKQIMLWWELLFCTVGVLTFAIPVVVGLFIGETGFKPRVGDAAIVQRDGKWPEFYWGLLGIQALLALLFGYFARKSYQQLRRVPTKLSNTTAESDARKGDARGSP